MQYYKVVNIQNKITGITRSLFPARIKGFIKIDVDEFNELIMRFGAPIYLNSSNEGDLASRVDEIEEAITVLAEGFTMSSLDNIKKMDDEKLNDSVLINLCKEANTAIKASREAINDIKTEDENKIAEIKLGKLEAIK